MALQKACRKHMAVDRVVDGFNYASGSEMNWTGSKFSRIILIPNLMASYGYSRIDTQF